MAERKLDHDREVALEQLPRSVRPAVAALWNLDLAFADVITTSTDPRLGAIRLAWWRERLEQLDQGIGAPAEPRLRAVARELVPRSVTGQQLSQLEDAWLPLLDPFPWGNEQADGLRHRGRILFRIGARLLGCTAESAEPAGAFWSLVDGARHCSDAPSRSFLLEQAAGSLAGLPAKMPTAVRGMTVLAALAAADLAREGSGGARLLAALRHRLFGTIRR